MRLENNTNWIELDFICYATDAPFIVNVLSDAKNYVETEVDFYVSDFGNGSDGYQYFHTKDIKAVAEGFKKVFSKELKEFTYCGNNPQPSSTDPLFAVFLKREQDTIDIKLQIFDAFVGPVSLTKTMYLSEFEKLTREFADIAQKFPVKE